MKVAVVKLTSLGDIIQSMVVVQFIKEIRPDISLDWFVDESFKQVVELNPQINDVHTVSLREVKKNKLLFFRELLKIKKYSRFQYDLVMDMQGLIKSAFVGFFLSNKRFGFDKNSAREKLATFFYTHSIFCPPEENTILRYFQLMEKTFNININRKQILKKKPYLFFNSQDEVVSKKYFSQQNKNIIFFIGSTWKSRMYPKEKFVELGRKIDANIMIPYGSSEEKEVANFIAQKLSNARVLPAMTINELKACISKADLLIGGDTGPSYIAWANNVPCILLFGPTPTSRIYETPQCRVLKSSSKVNPRMLDKNDFSIQEIEVDLILEKINELLPD